MRLLKACKMSLIVDTFNIWMYSRAIFELEKQALTKPAFWTRFALIFKNFSLFFQIMHLRFQVSTKLVFQASIELVLQDWKRTYGCKTNCAFQKNDAFLTPFFQALFQTRVFIGSTSQTSHTTSNHTANLYQTKPIKKLIKATNQNQTTHITQNHTAKQHQIKLTRTWAKATDHKPNNSHHSKSHCKTSSNQVNQNINQRNNSQTKQLAQPQTTLLLFIFFIFYLLLFC